MRTKPSAATQAGFPRLNDGLFAVLLLAATAVAYHGAWHAGFVWDDDGHVTRPEMRSLHGLWRIWFEVGATQQYYPVLHSAFWMEHRLWGDATLGYHLSNVFLHATAACLFAAILRRLGVERIAPNALATGQSRASALGAMRSTFDAPLLAAFLFALHPVCVESVAWISEQKNTLSAVFYLLSALVYLRWRDSRIEDFRRVGMGGPPVRAVAGSKAETDGRPARPCPQSRGFYFLALGLFILALLSKSV